MAKLSITNLENLPEWQYIVSKLRDYERDYVNEILTAAEEGAASVAAERSGRVSMIREVLEIPDGFLGGKEDAFNQQGSKT